VTPLSYNEHRESMKTVSCWGCGFLATRRLLSRDGLCPRCDSDAWDTVDGMLEDMRIAEDSGG
jgi:predicted Zn-ribbon and HTH transcriptional regulator